MICMDPWPDKDSFGNGCYDKISIQQRSWHLFMVLHVHKINSECNLKWFVHLSQITISLPTSLDKLLYVYSVLNFSSIPWSSTTFYKASWTRLNTRGRLTTIDVIKQKATSVSKTVTKIITSQSRHIRMYMVNGK